MESLERRHRREDRRRLDGVRWTHRRDAIDAPSRSLTLIYNAGNLDKKVKRRDGRLQAEHHCQSSITGYHDSDGGNADAFAKKAQDLDVVIEAVFENLELKHKVFGTVSGLAR